MSSLWHFRAFYRKSGAAYGSVERVYSSLGKDMESMWLSRAVYRKSMAVYGCEGSLYVVYRSVLYYLAVQGNVRIVCGSLGKCLWNSRELYSSLGKYMCSLGLSTGSLGQSTAV